MVSEICDFSVRMCKMDVDRDEFYRRLDEAFNNKKAQNSMLLTQEKYNSLLAKVKAAKVAEKKSPADYRRIKKYEVVSTPEGERLYATPAPGDNRRQMLVSIDEMYEIISEHHIKLNHGGRSRMMNELKHNYKNITTECVLIYLSMCKPCKKKMIKRGRSEWTAKKNNDTIECGGESYMQPTSHFSECSDLTFSIETEDLQNVKITSYKYPELYSRGQVDILCVTNEVGDEYKYLMVYRHFLTKFIHLKPMKALSVPETVDNLLDIFLTFGAPNILQSKNGLDVTKPICRKISTLFPSIKILASERLFTNHDFQGKANEDILKRLNEWLAKSQNTAWQEGVKIVQHKLNTTFNTILCRTPSEMVFGQNPSKGVASFMEKSVYEDLLTEEDLIQVIESRDKLDPIAPKQLQLAESLMLPTSFIKMETEMENESEGTIDGENINI